MKYKHVAYIVVSFFCAMAVTANEQNKSNRLIIVGAVGENDNNFKMLSYRKSFNNNFIIRGDVLEANYPTGLNQELEDTNETIRLAIGRQFASADGKAKATLFIGGLDQEDNDSSDSGLYVAAEYFKSFNEVNGFFTNISYSEPENTYYFGSHITFGVGNFHIGPAIAFLQSDDYEFKSYGLKLTTQVNDFLHLASTVSRRDGENETGSDLKSNVANLALIFSF